MTEADRVRADADGGWKDVIEDFTEEFFLYYFPEVHAAIDFSVPIEFLDTELRQIAPDADEGKRYADRLLKVQLRDGSEQWLYIHIEVQGETRESAEEFAERMFIYNYRIGDRYGRNVVSLAVLTDSDLAFHPTEYRREVLGCSTQFVFPTAKLATLPPHRLNDPSNVFALISRIQLEQNRVRRDNQARLVRKIALTPELHSAGMTRQRVFRLFRFLDFVMRLPPPLEIQYRYELERIEGELQMPYVTSIERMAKQEGELLKAREDVIDALEIRFGEVPYALREAVGNAESAKRLKELLRLAITVKSLDEFKV